MFRSENENIPQYTHDCTECIFLGRIDVINDAYLHPHILNPSIILRNGDGIEDNRSMYTCVIFYGQMKQAKTIAQERGLL